MKDITVSDAIRIGAAQGPQLFGRFSDINNASCATGALALGLFGSFYYKKWPDELSETENSCPVCGQQSYTCGTQSGTPIRGRFSILIHLNNDHRWTRERIADWYEATYEQPVESPLDALNADLERGALRTVHVDDEAEADAISRTLSAEELRDTAYVWPQGVGR